MAPFFLVGKKVTAEAPPSKPYTLLTSVHNNANDYSSVIGIAQLQAFSCTKNWPVWQSQTHIPTHTDDYSLRLYWQRSDKANKWKENLYFLRCPCRCHIQIERIVTEKHKRENFFKYLTITLDNISNIKATVAKYYEIRYAVNCSLHIMVFIPQAVCISVILILYDKSWT